MRQQENKAKQTTFFYFILLFTFLSVLVMTYIAEQRYSKCRKHPNIFLLNEWNYQNSINQKEDCTLPLNVHFACEDILFTLKTILPKPFSYHQPALYFPCNYLFFNVYVDNVLISTYQNNHFKKQYQHPIFRNRLVPLPKDIGGKTLTIQYKTALNTPVKYNIDKIYIGEKIDLFKTIYKNNSHALILVTTTFLLGLYMISIHIFFHRKHTVNKVIHIGIFSILIASYTFSQNRFIALNTSYALFLYVLEFTSFSLLPIPILMTYRADTKGRLRIFFNLVLILACINYFGQIIAYFYTSLNFRELLFVTYHMDALILFPIAIRLLYSDSRKHIFVLIPMLLGGAIDAVTLTLKNPVIETHFLLSGVVFYLICQIIFYVKEMIHIRYETMKSDFYKHMAYTDYLTKAYNRTALNEELRTFQYSKFKLNHTFCIFIDINNLKYVNDRFGHKYGDHVILSITYLIQEAFHSYGKLYRIGGDEFIVLIYNQPRGFVIRQLEMLHDITKTHNLNLELPLSFAIGYDSLQKGETLEELIRRCDQLMYENKKKMKECFALP